ncbi:MAG: hypothetical protein JJU18_01995 [Oceanicaulis sp.]|nr:hypothetical protein [Oceanicaulis sp.]
MSGLVPIPARHSGALVPTRRTARVEPACPVRDVREEPRRGVPDRRTGADRRSGARASAAPACPSASAGVSAGNALSLQAGPARRGLRADACERQRYQTAYGAAQSLAPAPRPCVEHAA